LFDVEISVVKSFDIKILYVERCAMMQPMDTQARRRLATERFELLRDDARPPARPAGHVRLRLGGLLVAAGLRLAPEARPLWLRPADQPRRGRDG
jgi:hypothetical protein